MVRNRCRTFMTSKWLRLINFESLVTYHSMFVISIQIIGRLFLNPCLSCFLYLCSVCLLTPVYFPSDEKKNNNTGIAFSFKFLQLQYPSQCILFEKRLCFKPKYIHFAYSFEAYDAFSSCLRREDQFVVVFSPRGARGHAVVMVNDLFSDLPLFWQ